jgi:hypothetical protein
LSRPIIARPRRHHLIVGESRFAPYSNGLLQQNRHKADDHLRLPRPFLGQADLVDHLRDLSF